MKRASKSSADRMADLRERRQREGWVQLNVWVKREWVEKVRRYVARLANGSSEPRT